MKRRKFITLLGGAVASWPLAARAQQPAMPLIGYLDPWSAEGHRPELTAFRRGLNEVGFIESRNVMIEYRWADGRVDRLPAMTADLLRRQIAVIFAYGAPAIMPSSSMQPVRRATGSASARGCACIGLSSAIR